MKSRRFISARTALTMSFTPDMLLRELRAALRDITHALKSVDDRITYVYVRPLESSGEDIVATRPAEAG